MDNENEASVGESLARKIADEIYNSTPGGQVAKFLEETIGEDVDKLTKKAWLSVLGEERYDKMTDKIGEGFMYVCFGIAKVVVKVKEWFSVEEKKEDDNKQQEQ